MEDMFSQSIPSVCTGKTEVVKTNKQNKMNKQTNNNKKKTNMFRSSCECCFLEDCKYIKVKKDYFKVTVIVKQRLLKNY